MVPGSRDTPLEVGHVLLADAICFDVAFDDAFAEQVRGGGQLIAVQTSNAMFINTAQPEQQFAISRLRALEMGRAVVVASTNGISGVIGPDGGVIATIPQRVTDSWVVEVPLSQRTTPAVRFNGLIDAGILGLSLASKAGVALVRLRSLPDDGGWRAGARPWRWAA